MFIYLKQKYPHKRFWINDIYEPLYHFWREVQQHPEALVHQIQLWKDKFNDGKELYLYLRHNVERFDELRKAAAFFVFNRITFSGTSESGGFSNEAFRKRFTQSSIERVKALSRILDNVMITNFDYQRVIEEEGNKVFIFLDPPYYSARKSALYGKRGELHKAFDHERLAKVLKGIPHKWLATYDDSEYIRKLFSFAHIKEWSPTYGMRNVGKNSNQKGQELFIANYPIGGSQKHLQRTLFEFLP